MKLNRIIIMPIITAITVCMPLLAQDFLPYNEDQIKTQIKEIFAPYPKLQETFAHQIFMLSSSPENMKITIFFLQNPLKYFDDEKRVPDPFSYFALYEQYLKDKKEVDANCFLLEDFFNQHFKTIDEKRIQIITFLLECSSGIDWDVVSIYYVKFFLRNTHLFIEDLRKRDNWRDIIKSSFFIDQDNTEAAIAELGNSEFEKELKKYMRGFHEELMNMIKQK